MAGCNSAGPRPLVTPSEDPGPKSPRYCGHLDAVTGSAGRRTDGGSQRAKFTVLAVPMALWVCTDVGLKTKVLQNICRKMGLKGKLILVQKVMKPTAVREILHVLLEDEMFSVLGSKSGFPFPWSF